MNPDQTAPVEAGWSRFKLFAGPKNGGSFSEMSGHKHIKLNTIDSLVIYFTYTLTETLVCNMCILTADYTVKPVLSVH